MASVKFRSLNREVQAEDGEPFRELIIREKIPMAFPCGGAGVCGKCRIRVIEGGSAPDFTERETLGEEQLKRGVRLACRLKVKGSMIVELIEHVTDEKILEVGSERGVEFDPFIKTETVSVDSPVLENPVSDAERLCNAAGKKIRNLNVLKKLPSVLRENDHSVEIVYKQNTILDVRPPEGRGIFAVGVDIGTTTVAATLVDMKTGRHIHAASVKNPQEPFGGDVVSRIQYCSTGARHLEGMSSLIRETIDSLMGDLSESAGIGREDIYDIAVVGNTVMNHLFLGLDPTYIALSPYVPVTVRETVCPAEQFGISINRNGDVFTCPNIAGFVGGDIVAGILDSGMLQSDAPVLLVDIGTNGEIALGSSEGVYVCSTAAGPAFEGVNLKNGMRAGKGAIERAVIQDGSVEIRTIGDIPAKGICGSGIIDIVSGMVKEGIIDRTGRFRAPDEVGTELKPRMKQGKNGEPEFVAVPAEDTGIGEDITITQKDIRELQLAKSAIASGIRILLDKAALQAGDVDRIMLAGAFGNYIRRESALGIGLFPGFEKEQIRFIGNAAGYGAVMMLLSKKELQKSIDIHDHCHYIEVGALPEFQSYFAEMMMF